MTAPLPLALIGLRFGRHIANQLTQTDAQRWFRLAAVCDLDTERADSLGQEHGVPAYHSIEDLLAREHVPCVGLFTGPEGRAGLVRQLVDAGRHVMTTKPFELDLQAARDVLAHARSVGRVVHMNSPSPDPPDLAQIRAWQQEHDLGRPVGARMESTASYREHADGSWYDDPDRCPVAPVFRLGIYLINDMVRLLGTPERVQVMHARLFTERPTPDNALLMIGFANGAIGSLYASFCVDDRQCYRNSLILNFERGTIFRNVGPAAAPDTGGADLALVKPAAPEGHAREILRAAAPACSGAYQWDLFHRACTDNDATQAAAPEAVLAGLRVIRAMHAAERSGRTEAVEDLPAASA